MLQFKRYLAGWVHDSTWMILVHVSVAAAAYVFWNLIVKIDNSYYFYETILKFIPFLLPSHPIDWFSTWEMGDPRPRLVTIVAEVANLHLRGWVAQWTILPPALGINWLIYPLVCFVLYRGAWVLSANRFVALSVSLLWGLSPAALDTLAESYVPAKPLMNLWFALALLAGARLQAVKPWNLAGATGRRAACRQAVILATVVFLGFLTDETVAIIVLCLPIILYRTFILARSGRGIALLAWGALAVPMGLFCLTALLIYPAINRSAGQVPLDYLQMVSKGPIVAYKGAPAAGNVSSVHLAGWVTKFHPVGAAYTMITAHLLPFRHIVSFWTSGHPLNIADWPRSEIQLVVLFFCVCGSTFSLLPVERKWFVGALLAAFGCLVFTYALLLIPLAPAITEVNYYGSLSSVLYALCIGFIFADIGSQRWQRWLALASILIFCSLELTSYAQTARRIRAVFSNHIYTGFDRPEVAWNHETLREISHLIAVGKFTEIAERRPYPSREFCYAFELEAQRQLSLGRKVDFVPTENDDALYEELLREHVASVFRTGTIPAVDAGAIDLKECIAAGANSLSPAELKDLLTNKTWHGANEEYSFTRTCVDGGFTERYWIPLVMRVWRQSGQISVARDGTLRVVGERSGIQELRVLRDKDFYLAFTKNGKFAFRFSLIPPVEL